MAGTETAGDSGKKLPEALRDAGLTTAKYVVYIGMYGERVIDTASWDHVGVKDQKRIVWSQDNGWAVPIDKFNDDALKYCDEQDADFVVRDVEITP